MEEILASIRRIISEDGEEVELPEAEADEAEPEAEVEEPADESAEDDSVLELTEVVDEPEAEAEPEGANDYEPIPDDLEPVADDEPLISSAPAETVANAFAQLSGAMLLQGLTLDELVRDMLKPMLKAWLDANLPQIVERQVEREISRLTGSKPRE